MKKNALIKGTFILTAAGLLSRCIGFFYRIFLSRMFGAEGMGIYELINPVLALTFALCTSGIQSAVSKFVAALPQNRPEGQLHILKTGLAFSGGLSVLCALFVYRRADFIAAALLSEPRCAPLLRIAALSFPAAAVHSCINGYFYGIKKAGLPAFCQLFEQCFRVGSVFLFWNYAQAHQVTFSITAAAVGLVIGEFASMLAAVPVTFLHFTKRMSASQAGRSLPHAEISGFFGHERGASRIGGFPDRGPAHTGGFDSNRSASRIDRFAPDRGASRIGSFPDRGPARNGSFGPVRNASRSVVPQILLFAAPLSANRVFLHLLGAMESARIPVSLQLFGYTPKQAISLYGIFTGMAMTCILFPTALTNSVSVLLMPLIAEADASGNRRAIRSAVFRCVRYCALMGFACMGFFLLSGPFIGSVLFHSETAGYFIRILSFLCPFLYLNTTLFSILNGLGKTGCTFLVNTAAQLVRIAFVFFAVPRFGLPGLLSGMVLAHLLTTLCCFLFLSGHLKRTSGP